MLTNGERLSSLLDSALALDYSVNVERSTTYGETEDRLINILSQATILLTSLYEWADGEQGHSE